MRKVVTVVGTRPEIIRLSRVIPELDRHFDHTLVHTGQNYDPRLSDVFFSELRIREPNFHLGAAGANAAETIANVLLKIDPLLAKIAPDALLLLGDTNSAFAAIAAKKRRIPIFHMEAGNRCFDERVPEEANRRLIDHVSDVNLTYSEHARRYLLAEGFPPDRVIKTGSPMFEVLEHHKEDIGKSAVLKDLGLERRKYFVLSAHREENVDDPANLERIAQALERLAGEFGLPIFFSVHPRTRKRLGESGRSLPKLVIQSQPLGFTDYNRLQQDAFCVLSDSGTVTEESSLLGFPAITIRQAHERPEGMDEGTLVMSGLDAGVIVEAVRMVTAQALERGLRPRVVADYCNPNVSLQVARIVSSYIDFVRQVVWRQA